MNQNPNVNYIEKTGPLTRVGILIMDEETACREAMEELGTVETPTMTDAQDWGWEVSFENAYLD
jgi:8-oxo-dGTP pyrophosphatase MutT (NUDIX family)